MSTSAETWNQRHRNTEAGAPDSLVVEAAALANRGTALDLACGRGRNAIYLAQAGFSVVALDFSEVAIASLKGRFENLDARLEDLETVHLPEAAFDLVCNIRYLQRSLFPAIRQALKPGGLFAALIAMPDADPAVKPMNSAYLIEPGELRNSFSGFEILREDERKSPGHRRMQQFLARNGSAR